VRISDALHWKPLVEWSLGRSKGERADEASARSELTAVPVNDDPASTHQMQPQPQSTCTPNGTIWVTTLVENSVTGRNIRAEHGLSFFIRTGRDCLLFDTGQSDLLDQNAREMQLRLDEVEAIALSHSHYDHTGGISAMRAIAPNARLFLHPAALRPKFAGNPDGTSRSVGLANESLQAIQQAGDRVVWTTQPTEVLDGIFVTGEIPRHTPFEDAGGAFFLDESCTQRDSLVDDQAMFFDTRDGVVVLLGCAHAGVVNTLNYVRLITRGRPIHSVLGGMHLLEADAHRIESTFARFRELDIRQLGPAHCTGVIPTARLRTEFPGRCVVCTVGSSLAFHR
jgi:7,8-dihydropterin-6-yl-methyl-4-(beta-D-ribofuranosyl)aminobenzene 5'-phosphate synthase